VGKDSISAGLKSKNLILTGTKCLALVLLKNEVFDKLGLWPEPKAFNLVPKGISGPSVNLCNSFYNFVFIMLFKIFLIIIKSS
jgi:hypothetical protein